MPRRKAPRKLSNKRSTKRARVADPIEDEGSFVSCPEDEPSSIYFVGRTGTWPRREQWYKIDLSKRANREGEGGVDVGGPAGLCALKMDMNYPIQKVSTITFGSFGRLIYGLGGWEARQSLVYFHRSVFFYDTENPSQGWFAAPDMIATRHRPSHRVVDGKLYVLGGISISEECHPQPRYPWGEYLDLSPYTNRPPGYCLPGIGEWHPLDFPLSPLSDAAPRPAFNLPDMEGNFDPDRHLLVGIAWARSLIVCYDVRRKSFSRFPASDFLGYFEDNTMVVEGGCIFVPNAINLLAVGLSVRPGSPPWFQGSVEGMHGSTCDRLPPLPPLCECDDYGYGEPMLPPDPAAFSLLRVAPCKYATLWCPYVCSDEEEREERVVRLSVFRVSPTSPPIMEDDTPLLRARFDVSDEHLGLGLRDFELRAAVAVRTHPHIPGLMYPQQE